VEGEDSRKSRGGMRGKKINKELQVYDAKGKSGSGVIEVKK